MTPGWSIVICAFGAPWYYATVEAVVNRVKLVDDRVDAFGLHGSGGNSSAPNQKKL